MSYEDYICETCGFTSQEKRGAYTCPKCGTQMKVHRHGRHGGGVSVGAGKLLIYILEFVILLPILFIFLNIPGLIIFIVILLLTRRHMNKNVRNKAITTSRQLPNPTKTYTCSKCGASFKGQQPKCPNCGITLNYKN